VGQAAVAPAVRFGDARRPEAATHVTIAEWDGPLGLLLSLIEARRLDVLSVPLGALAEAYLDALGGLTDDRIANISSFVAIASQLILIKSRAMLPRQEEVEASVADDDGIDPEAALRARLLDHVRPALSDHGDTETVTGLLRRLEDRGTGADRQRALFTSGVSTPAFITALARATLSGYEPVRWRRPGARVPAAAGAQ